MPRTAHAEVPRRYIPTLDGWRAIAILLVLCCHDVLHTVGPISTYWPHTHGAAGVNLFFAISGILICTLLLGEEQQTGTISLRGFYTRRAFRILPAAFVYIAVIAVLSTLHVLSSVHKSGLISSLLFCRNIQTFVTSDWYTGHFWTLSIEEHFYFILPAFLVFCKKYRAPILLCSGAAITCMGTIVEHLTHQFLDFSDFNLGALFIAAGMAVALQQDVSRLRRILNPAATFIIAAVVLSFLFTGRALVLALVLTALVASTMLRPDNTLGRFLESKPLRFIGKRSYSLYLWQELFMSQFWYPKGDLSYLQKWPLSILCAFACACLSYSLVEQPMRRLGQRLVNQRARSAYFTALTHVTTSGAR